MGYRMGECKTNFIAILLVLMLVYASSRADSTSVPSESSGPVFEGIGNLFVDLIPTNQPINLTFTPSVYVFDSDGVDTVIACYRNQSPIWINGNLSYKTSIWKNASLNWIRHIDDGIYEGYEYYGAYVSNYILDRNHGLVIWNMIFFANDTLGNWNRSIMSNISVCYWYKSETQYQILTFENILLFLLFASSFVTVVVYVKYCRNG